MENTLRIRTTASSSFRYVYFFIFLFPILPDYFRLFGIPVYTYLVLLFGFVTIISRMLSRKEMINECKVILYLFIVELIYLFPYLYHMEILQGGKLIIESVFSILGIYYSINSLDDIKKALKIVVCAADILCVFGIIEFFTEFNVFSILQNFFYENEVFGPASFYRLGIYRIESSFNNAISYCIYLGVCIVASVYLLINTNSKLFYLLSFAFMNVNVLMTVSRGPIILIFLIDIFCIFKLFSKKYKQVALGCIIVLLLYLVIDTIINTSNSLFSAVFESIYYLFNPDKSSSNTNENLNAFEYRGALFYSIYSALNNHRLFGYGATTDLSFYVNGWLHNSIDNAYLAKFYYLGYFGLVAFCISVIYPLFNSYKLRKFEIKNKNNLSIYLCIIFLFYFISMFMVAAISEYRIICVFVGLMFSYENNLKKSKR